MSFRHPNQNLDPIFKEKRDTTAVKLTNLGTALQYRIICRDTRGALNKHL
jgi:hypothetical protein